MVNVTCHCIMTAYVLITSNLVLLVTIKYEDYSLQVW